MQPWRTGNLLISLSQLELSVLQKEFVKTIYAGRQIATEWLLIIGPSVQSTWCKRYLESSEKPSFFPLNLARVTLNRPPPADGEFWSGKSVEATFNYTGSKGWNWAGMKSFLCIDYSLHRTGERERQLWRSLLLHCRQTSRPPCKEPSFFFFFFNTAYSM